MFIVKLYVPVMVLVAVLASVGYRRAGWLDRVVAWRKEKFIRDVQKYAPIKINAQLHPSPPGYVDSQEWTYDSVVRLLALIKGSESARPVFKKLRRMLQPTRRMMMSMKESLHRFPSLSLQENNEFYYSIEHDESDEDGIHKPTSVPIPENDIVVVVSNPVEARLPSARISVQLLREILEARAKAGRAMVTTPKPTIWWKPMNKSCQTTPGDGAGGDGTTGGDGDGGGGAGEGGTGEPGEPGEAGEPGEPGEAGEPGEPGEPGEEEEPPAEG